MKNKWLKSKGIIIAIAVLSHSVHGQWVKVWSDSLQNSVSSILVYEKNIFVGVHGSGVFLSSDNGSAWGLVDSSLTKSVNDLARSGNVLFAGTDNGIRMSTNSGGTWMAADSTLTDTIYALFVNGNAVFAGTVAGGVFKSTDNGATWIEGKVGPISSSVISFAANGSNLYAGTMENGVFRSQNNGESWTRLYSGPLDSTIISIAISKNNTIFATAYKRGIYQLGQMDTRWNHIALESTYCPKLAMSGDKIFAGAWFDGVFVSIDNGEHWTEANSGLLDEDLNAISMTSDYLLVGTYTGGVWRRPISEMPELLDTANIQPQKQEILACWSFDSVSDNKTFYDVTGNGYDAICSRSLKTQRGLKGKALVSDTTDYIILTEKTNPAFSVPEFSIEVWINSFIDLVNIGSFFNFKSIFHYTTFTSHAPGKKGIAKGYNLSITDAGAVLLSTANADSTWTHCVGTSVLKPHKWYHIVATYDGVNMNVYVNGILEKSVKDKTPGYIAPDENATISSQAEFQSTSVRGWFNGKIDELKLYSSVLDPKTILLHFNELNPEYESSFNINLGIKTMYALPGDTVVMPVCFANHENYNLNTCQLTLTFDTTKVALLSLSKDSGAAKTWEFFDWKPVSSSSVAVTMSGTSMHSLNYGENELFRGIFRIAPEVQLGDTCWVLLDDIDIDNQAKLVTSTSQDGRIIMEKKDIRFGDVTGEGEVTLEDAKLVQLYAAGKITLPDAACCPYFTKVAADVSGNGSITGYDGVLIEQYDIGMISSFPVETPKPVIKRACLFMKTWSTVDSEINYDLVGINLKGYLAGDFTITCDADLEQLAVGTIVSDIRGARLESNSGLSKTELKVVVTTIQPIRSDDSLSIFRISMPPSRQNPNPSFTITSASINEGKIEVGYDTASTIPKIARQQTLCVRVVNRTLRVASNEGTVAKVTIWNLNGRRIIRKNLINGAGSVDLKNLSRGVYIYRLQKGPRVITERFILSR